MAAMALRIAEVALTALALKIVDELFGDGDVA